MGLVVLIFQDISRCLPFPGGPQSSGGPPLSGGLPSSGGPLSSGVFLFLNNLSPGHFLYLVAFHLYYDNVSSFQSIFVHHVVSYYYESHYHSHQDILLWHCSCSSDKFLFWSSSYMNRSRTIQLRHYISNTWSYRGASNDVSIMGRKTTMRSGHWYIPTVTIHNICSSFFPSDVLVSLSTNLVPT